ncbi:urease subunit beta [Streptomyces anulatus]
MQVGSHLHFSDANPALCFDPAAGPGFGGGISNGPGAR